MSTNSAENVYKKNVFKYVYNCLQSDKQERSTKFLQTIKKNRQHIKIQLDQEIECQQWNFGWIYVSYEL